MDLLDITVSNFMDRSICLKMVKELFSAYALKSFSHGLSPIMRSKTIYSAGKEEKSHFPEKKASGKTYISCRNSV